MHGALREGIRDCLLADGEAFERRSQRLATEHDFDIDPPDGTIERDPAGVTGQLDSHERELIRRIRWFDTGPLGLTLSGPAYRDNPLLYANRTFRDLTGYSLVDLRGENPRLLQGPDSEPAAIDSLREAIDIWESTTVDLWNYRADGSEFRNRVSLVPIEDGTGMVTNWLGIQERVDDGSFGQ